MLRCSNTSPSFGLVTPHNVQDKVWDPERVSPSRGISISTLDVDAIDKIISNGCVFSAGARYVFVSYNTSKLLQFFLSAFRLHNQLAKLPTSTE